MKKTSLLIVAGLLLTGCSTAANVAAGIKKKYSQDEVASKFAAFFSGSYSIDSTVYNGYLKETFKVKDMVSSNAKANVVYDSDDNIVSYTSIVSKNGFAVEEYISLSNTIETRSFSSSPVSFKDNYGSPLSKVAGSSASIGKYFDVKANEDETYTYTANAQGLAKASSIFGSFFAFYGDVFNWDSKTVQESIDSLSITSDVEGNPAKMSFIKIKKDRFGGLKESFDSTLSAIENVPSIPTVSSSDDETTKNALKTSLELLGENVKGANFTQTVKHPYLDESDLNGVYHNYYCYDENGFGAMLCDIPWYSAEYGKTYIGAAYSSFYGYYMCGVSPEADYSGITSNQYFDSVLDFIPQIDLLSNEFFTYNAKKGEYVFDLDKFYFDDYAFSFDILNCLFGLVDPCADKFGYYLSDTADYAMNFHYLSIKIDEAGLPVFTLNYEDSRGDAISAVTSFGEFGTTDLSTNKDLKDAFAILIGE